MRSQLASYKQLACCRIWGRTYQEDGPSPSSAFPTTPPATTFQAARRLRWHSTRSMRTTSLSSVVSFCGCGAGRTLFFSKATVEGEVEAIRLEGPACRIGPAELGTCLKIITMLQTCQRPNQSRGQRRKQRAT